MAASGSSVPMPIHSDIWYSDGSIIIQAENTQFRVHASILAKDSTMFNDMFNLAQPHEQPRVEGCPVIIVTDTATDWKHVLTALYNRLFYKEAKKPFPVVAAMLRLGRKYGFDSLYNDAMDRFMVDYPTMFEDWTAAYLQLRVENDDITLDVVNLFEETGLISHLPSALYWICQGSMRGTLGWLVQGDTKDDDTTATLSETYRDTCALACPRLLEAQFHHTFAWLDTKNVPSPACTSQTKCRKARAAVKNAIWIPVPGFKAIDEWDEEWEEDLCDACISVAKSSHETGRGEIWSRLPSFFDLPPWEELEKQSRAV